MWHERTSYGAHASVVAIMIRSLITQFVCHDVVMHCVLAAELIWHICMEDAFMAESVPASRG